MQESQREILGEYELLELLGDGAQGKVFKARRIKPTDDTPEFVAVKLLRLKGDDEEAVDKFHRSADILRQLSHPNIVRYIDTFTWNAREWDESHCLVMEYLEGETLTEKIKRHPRGLPWPEVKDIFERCLEALIYARTESIIHRDIKPSNIFLDGNGGVKIIDFDIARHEQSGQVSTVGWKGTFDYMAPDFVSEQNFRGDELSDVFSLGVCFYQALAGQLPFEPFREGAQIGYLNRWQDLDSVDIECKEGVFRALINVTRFVRMSIAPRRENRYPSFAEQLKQLRAIRYRTLVHKHRDSYELTGGLGRSALSEVFQARRVHDGKAVAVKELFTGAASRGFIRGIHVLQKYPHPGIVKHIDFIAVPTGKSQKKFFLVLEALKGMPGMSLAQRLSEARGLPPGEVLPLFCQYLSALRFLHEDPRPIVHGDIRPSNLYAPLGRPERGKLMDIGVDRDAARQVRAEEAPGILDYMAPEYVKGRRGRGLPAGDLYSLGLCFYEALTGRPAFPRLPQEPAETWQTFQNRAASPPVPDFEAAVFKHYPRLVDIITSSLQLDVAERYPDAAAMRNDIEGVLRELKAQDTAIAEAEQTGGDWTSDSLEQATRPPVPTRATGADAAAAGQIDWSALRSRDVRRRRLVGSLAMALLLAGTGVGAWFLSSWWQQKRAEPHPPPVTQPSDVAQREARGRKLQGIVASLPKPVPTVAYANALSRAAEDVRLLGETDAELAETCRQAATRLQQLREDIPGLFLTAVERSAADGMRDATEALLAEWDDLSGSAQALGLSAEEHAHQARTMRATLGRSLLNREASELGKALPAALDSAATTAAAEQAGARLNQALTTPWPGITPAQMQQQLKAVREALQALTLTHLSALSTQAEELVKTGQPLKPVVDQLQTLKRSAPSLVELFSDAFAATSTAMGDLDAGRRAFAQEVGSVLQAMPATFQSGDLSTAEELAGRLKTIAERTWPGLDESRKRTQLAEVEQVLRTRAEALVLTLAEGAVRQFEAGKDGSKVRHWLAELSRAAPAVHALVADRVAAALNAIDAASLAAARDEPKPPDPPAAKTDPVDPGRDAFLNALTEGTAFSLPESSSLDPTHTRSLLAAAMGVRASLEVSDLAISRQAGEAFLSRVAETWAATEAFKGDFGDMVQKATWGVIHEQLTEQAKAILGVGRTPGQKAQIRLQFLHLIARVESISGKISTCPENDSLREFIGMFYSTDVDKTALIAAWTPRDRALESTIPWLGQAISRVRSDLDH